MEKEKHVNSLIRESSPYLLQHAHNPVQWHAWGPEAFARARGENKPVFLSIGYSTCYWCHVMERESFENEATAALLNEHYVCIKVDREERPDVDELYMMAVQLMTGRGGWPMSVFLLPPARDDGAGGLLPFYAGTYFPPEGSHGMPGFKQVLIAIAEAWKGRTQEVQEQAQKLARGVAGVLEAGLPPESVDHDLVDGTVEELLLAYDPEHGGFGGAPKFPQPANLLFLLCQWERQPQDRLATALAHTLDRMARGGMFDQVGGGFHRYSVDEKWLVPHFEKMLYDQGQLLELYAHAHELSRTRGFPMAEAGGYERVLRDTCDYLLREMRDPTGAFWSAQDAEVEAREGGNYLWQEDEIREAIPDKELADWVIRLYGVDEGANFTDPHHPQAPPSNVLYRPRRMEEAGSGPGQTAQAAWDKLRRANAHLLEARNKRLQPGTDDKVLAGWNGLAIAGLAEAGRVLGDSRYVSAACEAMTAVKRILDHPQEGLHRSWRKGVARVHAVLEDYAALAHAALALHRATQDESWVREAETLLTRARQLCAHEKGGYYDAPVGTTDLFVRGRVLHDGAIPSGNTLLIQAMVDLHQVTGDRQILQHATEDIRGLSGQLKHRGAGMPGLMASARRVLEVDAGLLAQHAAPPGDAAASAGDRPLTLRCDPVEVDLTSGRGEFTLHLKIAPGHHLAGARETSTYAVATRVLLLDDTAWEMRVDYPTGRKMIVPGVEQTVEVYEGQVAMRVTLVRQPNMASTESPRLRLRVQLCTDRQCLAPASLPLPVRWRE